VGRRAADEQEVAGKPHTRGSRRRVFRDTVALTALVAATVSCEKEPTRPERPAQTTLRVGVAQLLATSQVAGLVQLAQILTIEGLARVGEDGRMQPSLADSWTFDESSRMLRVKLRAGVTFTDGTPLDERNAVQALNNSVRELLGPLFDDVDQIVASGDHEIEFRFRRPSLLHLETLEASIVKPGSTNVGTGAYAAAEHSTTDFHGYSGYYLGKPSIDHIVVSNFPSVRAAWAEALRGNIDLLYEVSTDALDSLEHSTTISTHVITRRYQHVVVLNPGIPSLRSPEIRQALNAAIDRDAFVRNALNGYGVPSTGPIWPHYWALTSAPPGSKPVGDQARLQKSKLSFTCLVVPGAVDERIALELKRQFSVAGVEMIVESVTREEIHDRMAQGKYDAALLELISGPTFLRPYLIWFSKGPINLGKFGNKTVDVALQRARNAETENAFKTAVAGVQHAFEEDPPAIFLAWSQRARAVSNHFVVPPADSGRDIMSTLRMWKPADAAQTTRH